MHHTTFTQPRKSVNCIVASIPVLMTREDDDMIFDLWALKSPILLISGLSPYTVF